jgi:DNA-binding NarL/FixJ family response regulator
VVRKRVVMAEERFVTLTTVQRELVLTTEQVLILVTSGDLPAIRLFGFWRVERQALEQFISLAYEDTARLVQANKTTEVHGRPAGRRPPTDRPEEDSLGGHAFPRGLTPQMTRVLQLVAQGLSNAEIASELSVEVSTAKSHVSRLLTRLGVRDRANLIAFAWQTGVARRDG